MGAAFPKTEFRTPESSAGSESVTAPCHSAASSISTGRRPSAPPSAKAAPEPRGMPGEKNPARTKILLADDHAVVRQGLKLILADHFKRAVFGEARNAEEAFTLMAKKKWDVGVLDVTMGLGLEVLKEMKRLRPQMPVLILSLHPERQFAVRMLKAGASGYLTKDSAGEELVGAIEKVVEGGRYVSASLAQRMASYLEVNLQKAPHERLSDREFLVLRMLAAGKTVLQIANELLLSTKTVETCRSRVLEKMAMKNNAELTQYALKRQLL